jgi:3-oxoadipate enol-lactonase
VALILLHPIGLDAHCWDWLDVGQALKPTFPGHGSRPRPKRVASLDDIADEIAGQSDGRLDVVGVSMGGAVAQHLALRHPSRVHSLMLACTGGNTNREKLRERGQAAEDGGMESVLASTMQRWFTPEALEADPPHPGVAYARSCLMAMDPTAFADAWRALAEHDVLDRLKEICVPVTCLAASSDASSPVSARETLTRRLPNARMVILDGPHMIHLENPVDFSQAVRDHVSWSSATD